MKTGRRKTLLITGIVLLSGMAWIAHLRFNGTLEKSFVSPDGKARLDAYRLFRVKNFMPAMPGDGGWHCYSFRLEIEGLGEVRRSAPVFLKLSQDPPRWGESWVQFNGDPDLESWDISASAYRR